MLKRIGIICFAIFATGSVVTAQAETSTDTAQEFKYKVTITNITKGQSFTPQLVVTHEGKKALFRLGSPASPGLGRMAEGGDTSVLLEELMYADSVADYAVIEGVEGLLVPGETASVVVTADRHHRYLSLAGMFLPTNDTFVALNRIRLPRHAKAMFARAYDAGTEYNDQNCANIPGPVCGGTPFSDPSEMDEGFVYVSNGIHELPQPDGDDAARIIGPQTYDWRNPVARIVVKRLY